MNDNEIQSTATATQLDVGCATTMQSNEIANRHASDRWLKSISFSDATNQSDCIDDITQTFDGGTNSTNTHHHHHHHHHHYTHDNAQTKLSSTFGATINLVNCAIGAGVIGLPYALSHLGLLFGVPLLLLVALLTHFSTMLLVKAAHSIRVTTYQGLALHLLGRTGFAFLSFSQFILPFGTLCAYGIIIGDYLVHLHSFIPIDIIGVRWFVIVFSTVAFMLPLSFYTNMAKLEKFSMISIASVIVLIIAIAVRAPHFNSTVNISSSTALWGISQSSHKLAAIGVLLHAFVCQHNLFLVYESFEQRSPKRFSVVSLSSVFIVLFLNLALALVGFISFGSQCDANIINNFVSETQQDVVINIARLAFSLNVIVTFPTQVFVCRLVVERVFFPSSYTEFKSLRHTIITLAIVFAAVCIAIFTSDLGVLLELNGSIAASAVAFVFPALFALAYYRRSTQQQQQQQQASVYDTDMNDGTTNQPGNKHHLAINSNDRITCFTASRLWQRLASTNTAAYGMLIIGVGVMLSKIIETITSAATMSSHS